MSASLRNRVRIVVRGTVQGVGFRPFIYRLAHEHSLSGWVANTSEGVIIEAEGEEHSLSRFTERVTNDAPPLAVVESVAIEALSLTNRSDAEGSRFEIRASQAEEGQFVPVSPDVATCDDCRRELFDPADRRYGYPFINCTNCGPRFTIVEDIPYDRPKTTMGSFPMCPECAAEYHDPADRRFHAQPDACAICGPTLSLVGRDGAPLALDTNQRSGDARIIAEAARLLLEGQVLAVRGVGGFHLVCDATNERAVATLRQRKRRVGKPFALMSADIAEIERYCAVSDAEKRLLETSARPIVLLDRLEDNLFAEAIASEVAPGNRTLGVMLPYTPLHHLLLAELRIQAPARYEKAPLALVMTSGNLSEEPIAIGNDEALARLGGLADAFLLHNREIASRLDDSVARVFRGRPMLLRRSRGYTPAPIKLGRDLGQVLAVGGELKNTFCLTRDDYAFLGPHIGDLQNYETYSSLVESVEHFQRLFRIEPKTLAYDLHPGYLSTEYARERLAREAGLIGVGVQHHEAHVASCLVENCLEGDVIGVAFDGTGYGPDGAIWGGEVFVGGLARMERRGHLGYIPLPGGDLAVKHPWRSALAYLQAAYGDLSLLSLPLFGRIDEKDCALVLAQAKSGLNAPQTSSVGRLFDAVSSLLGVRDSVSYEGQAAIELEALADLSCLADYEWQPTVDEKTNTLILRPETLLRRIVADHLEGAPIPEISAKFHNSLARALVALCQILRAEVGLDRVCLSGGVFANAFLLGRAIDWLEKAGFVVYTHRLVPPNDGGIALGQAAIASARRND